ncbi:class I SAM-dependent methyltransferase [Brevibacterium sp.]|uniref:class I SAM-dependent methyltransferase n=1 Tax=Brevibacterium sp. TaxID=1701 RepID=UPI0025BEF835|nr:class I SAM-dependent methyltransferase [Brevibacterium sp.]
MTSAASGPDAIFADARLAAVYDAFEGDRDDLAAYAAMAEEFRASHILDIGCGTGAFATSMARRGLRVTAADPAEASLTVAQGKPGAAAVRWVHGTAQDVLPLQADLAFMTANVAQVFLTDAEWMSCLHAIRAALRPGGRLVFESRDPRRRAWEDWTRARTHRSVRTAAEGEADRWEQLRSVDGEFVTFETVTVFRRDGERIDSSSTLRFRSREALAETVERAGFTVEEVRDAPDRPGREFVFVARRPGESSPGERNAHD